jgi:hypothetical protein
MGVMSAPLTPESKERLQAVHRRLLPLHKAMLDAERADFEGLYGQVSPLQMLQLALSDPQFAWLKAYSDRILQIDALTDDKNALEAQAELVLVALSEQLATEERLPALIERSEEVFVAYTALLPLLPKL